MSDDRTEEATPKKLREARERGEAPRSRDVGTAFALLATLAFGAGVVNDASAFFRASFAQTTSQIERDQFAALVPVTKAAFSDGLALLTPALLGLACAAVAASMLQTGPMFASKALRMDASRLDPIAGAKRLFSMRAVVDFIKQLVRIGLVLGVLWALYRASAAHIFKLADAPAVQTLPIVGAMLKSAFLRVAGVMAIIGVLDVIHERKRFADSQKMSKEEVKREHKDQDGDPHAKAERDRVRREMSEHDVLERVRKSSVLVVNPTHIAIALDYDAQDDDAAPTIAAKGVDDLAKKMIAAAQEAGVPVVRDIALARALHALAQQDVIPESLFESVAVVFAEALAIREQEQKGEP